MDINELKDKLLSALGQATEAAKELSNKAADVTKDFAGKAADKAKAGARIAKLNIEISQEKENMRKTYLEIGKLYYDMHKDDPDGFFIQLCEEINTASKAIAEKEAEIADLKDGFSEEDVEVEFEEVVEQEEAAADTCSCVVEQECEELKNDLADIENDIKQVADEIEDKIGETEE